MSRTIDRTTSIEDLLVQFPAAVSIMLRNNLACLVCGEPVWGTVEELARTHGWEDENIGSLVRELNKAFAESRGQ